MSQKWKLVPRQFNFMGSRCCPHSHSLSIGSEDCTDYQFKLINENQCCRRLRYRRDKFKVDALLGLWVLAALFPLVSAPLYAEESVIAKVTVIIASNQGSDFDLENDAFRDQLIQIFSYKSYKQVKEYSIHLEKVNQKILMIPGDYEFVLTYRGQDQGRVRIGALIQKGGRKFLNTEVTMIGTGPVFLGGPPTESGDLLIVIEMLP